MNIYRHIHTAFLGLALLISAFSTTDAKTDQSVSDTYYTLLKQKFPIERKIGTYVGYRYSHAPVPGDLEYSFVLVYGPIRNMAGDSIPIIADVHLAETASIYEQVSALREKNPNVDALTIMGKLKIRSSHLNEQQCPAVREQFEKFTKLEFTGPRFDFISLDAPDHEFKIKSSTGDMTFELIDENYPLVKWAVETRLALESCISRNSVVNAPKD